MNKKVIITGVILLLIIGLGVAGFFLKGKQATKPAPSTYTDPGTGKQITDNAPLSQGDADNPDPLRPIFIGFTTLTDRGLSQSQRTQVENAIYSYSSQQSLGFKEVSLTVSSLETTPLGSNSPDYYMNFMITVNRKTQYYVHVSYSDFMNCTTAIYESDKTTHLFTQ